MAIVGLALERPLALVLPIFVFLLVLVEGIITQNHAFGEGSHVCCLPAGCEPHNDFCAEIL